MPRRPNRPPPSPAPWESERTLAAAEEDARLEAEGAPKSGSTSCVCGSGSFLLEAYLHVVDGVPAPVPVEMESLTCPECGREFEAIVGEGGRILRGDFLGWLEDDQAGP